MFSNNCIGGGGEESHLFPYLKVVPLKRINKKESALCLTKPNLQNKKVQEDGLFVNPLSPPPPFFSD